MPIDDRSLSRSYRIVLFPTRHPVLSIVWLFLGLVVFGTLMKAGLSPQSDEAKFWDAVAAWTGPLGVAVVCVTLFGLILGPYGMIGFLLRIALERERLSGKYPPRSPNEDPSP